LSFVISFAWLWIADFAIATVDFQIAGRVMHFKAWLQWYWPTQFVIVSPWMKAGA
jgi:hypothetical protein